ncbi:MAG TPA: glycosyltransferase family A protein, partial [Thermodesulfovibrionales bacterium]|nr:glycosyltransferase family A protein [Thermodesulfovibrionales bacterium]
MGKVENSPVSVIIPTYRREQVLLDTIQYLHNLQPPPAVIIVIDQTGAHEVSVQEQLDQWDKSNEIRWVRLKKPSIPGAMNKGLLYARNDIVLFLDDDIIPSEILIVAHGTAHGAEG